jgi:oxygen-independent coproporphyrinogen-3 oxidase
VAHTPKDISLYIHWPFCKAKCPYCDFNSHVREGVDHGAWQAALLAELAYWQARLRGRRLTSIFLGGGTPSLMPPALVAALIEAARAGWTVCDDVEITLEANPTSVEAGSFAGFRQAGVNRLSMGAQSLRPERLAFLGREHSVEEAKAALNVAFQHFDRVSFDLIYTTPGQSLAEWQEELREAIAMGVDHLSLYQLTIEPGTAFYQQHRRKLWELPEDELAAALYEVTQDITAAAGLPSYEISNHAAPGQESRHNLAYWQAADWVGIGPGAFGRWIETGQHGEMLRLESRTLRSPERWLNAVQTQGHGVEGWQQESRAEYLEEMLFSGLRLVEGIERKKLEDWAEKPWEFLIPPTLWHELVSEGWMEATASHIRASTKGRMILNRLLEELLAALVV